MTNMRAFVAVLAGVLLAGSVTAGPSHAVCNENKLAACCKKLADAPEHLRNLIVRAIAESGNGTATLMERAGSPGWGEFEATPDSAGSLGVMDLEGGGHRNSLWR